MVTMTESEARFLRLKEEHARLHDPSVLRGAVELVPIDLRELTLLAARRKKKTKGRKRGTAGPSHSVATQAGEQLLPVDFLRALIEPTPDAQSKDKTAKRPKSDPAIPQIKVGCNTVTLNVRLFQEITFALDVAATKQVELVWRNSKNAAKTASELQQVVMDHRHGDHFETQIGIADGDYHFAYKVDGQMRTDARFSQHVFLSREGLFTPRTLRRHSQTICVANKGPSPEQVRFQTNQPWIMPPASIDVPAHGSVEAIIRFAPPLMKIGLNEGLFHLFVPRDGHEIEAGKVHFSVEAHTSGAMPSISFSPLDLGQLRQGMDQRQLSVQITALGRGLLNGMISLPHSGELIDFHLDADDFEKARRTHTFQIHSSGLPRPQPNQVQAQLRLMVLTDSFLGNYRICRAEIPYSLVHLKKSLPALSFGTVRLGKTKVMRLEVKRSDNQSVDLDATLPTGAASYLHVSAVRPDTYDFRFDATSLMPGTSISETVELIDRNSGLRDQVKVLATVAHDSVELSRAQFGPITS